MRQPGTARVSPRCGRAAAESATEVPDPFRGGSATDDGRDSRGSGRRARVAGNSLEAERLLRGLALDPASVVSCRGLVNLYRDAGMHARARGACGGSSRSNRNYANHLELAQVCGALAEPESAEAASTWRSPSDPMPRRHLPGWPNTTSKAVDPRKPAGSRRKRSGGASAKGWTLLPPPAACWAIKARRRSRPRKGAPTGAQSPRRRTGRGKTRKGQSGPKGR